MAAKKVKKDRISIHGEGIETCLNKKKQQESISAGEGSKFRATTLWIHNYPEKVWEMSYRRSADGQNTAQNCTTMGVMVTMQFWTAVSPQKKISNRFFVIKL